MPLSASKRPQKDIPQTIYATSPTRKHDSMAHFPLIHPPLATNDTDSISSDSIYTSVTKLNSNSKVSFFPRVRFHAIPCIEDWTAESKLLLWYSPDECSALRSQALSAAEDWETIGGCSSSVANDDTLGLEPLTPTGAWEAYRLRRRAYDAVMDTQEIQWNEQRDDPLEIAHLYAEQVAPNVLQAVRRAKWDTRDAVERGDATEDGKEEEWTEEEIMSEDEWTEEEVISSSEERDPTQKVQKMNKTKNVRLDEKVATGKCKKRLPSAAARLIGTKARGENKGNKPMITTKGKKQRKEKQQDGRSSPNRSRAPESVARQHRGPSSPVRQRSGSERLERSNVEKDARKRKTDHRGSCSERLERTVAKQQREPPTRRGIISAPVEGSVMKEKHRPSSPRRRQGSPDQRIRSSSKRLERSICSNRRTPDEEAHLCNTKKKKNPESPRRLAHYKTRMHSAMPVIEYRQDQNNETGINLKGEDQQLKAYPTSSRSSSRGVSKRYKPKIPATSGKRSTLAKSDATQRRERSSTTASSAAETEGHKDQRRKKSRSLSPTKKPRRPPNEKRPLVRRRNSLTGLTERRSVELLGTSDIRENTNRKVLNKSVNNLCDAIGDKKKATSRSNRLAKTERRERRTGSSVPAFSPSTRKPMLGSTSSLLDMKPKKTKKSISSLPKQCQQPSLDPTEASESSGSMASLKLQQVHSP